MVDSVELNRISSVSRTKAVVRKSSVQEPRRDRKRPAKSSGQRDEEEPRIGGNIDERC